MTKLNLSDCPKKNKINKAKPFLLYKKITSIRHANPIINVYISKEKKEKGEIHRDLLNEGNAIENFNTLRLLL